MSALYARIHADRSSTSRTSSHSVFTTVETWKAIVTTALHEDGTCYVTITDKHGNNRQTLWEGNADERATAQPPQPKRCGTCGNRTETGRCMWYGDDMQLEQEPCIHWTAAEKSTG